MGPYACAAPVCVSVSPCGNPLHASWWSSARPNCFGCIGEFVPSIFVYFPSVFFIEKTLSLVWEQLYFPS
jgi:hypothetical protein